MLSEPDEIIKILEGLKKETRAIRKQIIEICWYMKGSITWEEAWGLSPEQRKDIVEFVNDINKKQAQDMPH